MFPPPTPVLLASGAARSILYCKGHTWHDACWPRCYTHCTEHCHSMDKAKYCSKGLFALNTVMNGLLVVTGSALLVIVKIYRCNDMKELWYDEGSKTRLCEHFWKYVGAQLTPHLQGTDRSNVLYRICRAAYICFYTSLAAPCDFTRIGLVPMGIPG